MTAADRIQQVLSLFCEFDKRFYCVQKLQDTVTSVAQCPLQTRARTCKIVRAEEFIELNKHQGTPLEVWSELGLTLITGLFFFQRALGLAAGLGEVELVVQLLRAGADPTAPNEVDFLRWCDCVCVSIWNCSSARVRWISG